MKHLFDEYKQSLKLLEVEELLDVIFYRPLAFVFVKSIYKASITPNQITCIAVIFGIVGGGLLSSDTYHSNIAAALFLVLYVVFDCGDGMLARLKKNGSPFGRALDGLSDYIVGSTIYIGIAIRYAGHEHSTALLLLTFIAAASNSLHAILVDYYRLRFAEFTRTPEVVSSISQPLKQENSDTQTKGILEKFLAVIDEKYANVQRIITRRRVNDQLVRGEEYYHKNKSIMHYWTYLGTSTQFTLLFACAMLHRIDIYLIGIVVAGNIYAITLSIIQSRIDAQLHIHSQFEVVL